MKYLIQVDMLVRERAPDRRRDHYRVHESAWYGAIRSAHEVFRRFEEGAREGVAVFGADTPVGARLEETWSFFAHLSGEVPELLRKWRETPPPASAP
ncbi:MAG TPA: hypothetical protein VM347_23805 [Nonomuraea sp.]|nr:hypothetical protein [Nonomuraea sp.]